MFFRKNPIAFFRFIDENMGDGSHQHTILNDRAAAHSLNNAAGFFPKVQGP